MATIETVMLSDLEIYRAVQAATCRYDDDAALHAAQRADELPTTGSREPPGSHFTTPTTSTMSPLWDAWEAQLSCVRQERISRANSGLSSKLDEVESCQRG